MVKEKNSSIDVLFLSHRYDITSGGEKALIDLIEHLVSLGLRIHVVIGDKGDIVGYLDKWNVTYSVVHLPFWARGGEDKSPFIFDQPSNPSNNTLLKLVEIIEDLNPRLCATNTIVMPWLAYAAAITNTPHAWMVHELHTAGLDLRYAIDKKQVLNTIDVMSDAVFYNSNYTASYYLPEFTFNKEAFVVYPVGSTQLLSTAANESPFSSTGLKIICVGQIKPQKGQLDAVQAAVILKERGIDFELLLVGGYNEDDASYRDEILRIIDKNNLGENVHLLGHSDNPASLVAHADIALNCATNETFGRVTVEAMMSGTTVIGANSAGTTEIIKDNKTGLLYRPGDSRDLVEKISMLNNNRTLLDQLSNDGMLFAKSEYSDKNRFKHFVDYLNNNPERNSLSMSPLRSVFEDFTTAIGTSAHPSRLMRGLRMIKRVTTKHF